MNDYIVLDLELPLELIQSLANRAIEEKISVHDLVINILAMNLDLSENNDQK